MPEVETVYINHFVCGHALLMFGRLHIRRKVEIADSGYQ